MACGAVVEAGLWAATASLDDEAGLAVAARGRLADHCGRPDARGGRARRRRPLRPRRPMPSRASRNCRGSVLPSRRGTAGERRPVYRLVAGEAPSARAPRLDPTAAGRGRPPRRAAARAGRPGHRQDDDDRRGRRRADRGRASIPSRSSSSPSAARPPPSCAPASPAASRRTIREPLARTFHSYAYGVLRRAALLRGEPPPRLLTSAEQDAVVAELLSGDAEGEGAVRWPAGWPRRWRRRASAGSCANCCSGRPNGGSIRISSRPGARDRQRALGARRRLPGAVRGRHGLRHRRPGRRLGVRPGRTGAPGHPRTG